MQEDEPPIIPPEEEPEPGEEAPEVAGEPLEAPTVPLAGEFEVRKVTRLPEDPSHREKIRKEYDGRAGGIGLGQAGVDRPAINPGRKGRGKIDKEDKE